jgi:single-stranded-DNA-specific exonuclease
VASTAIAKEFELQPYDYGEARRIAAALKLSEPIAVMLVRRGHRTVEDAREFLEAKEAHDPFAFEGMRQVCDLVRETISAGGRITVHGDYDVDGVTSTAIAIGVLRELGADCDWLIPDRLGEGYGLTMATIDELKRRGTGLLITTDCGIGSAPEVEAALAAGIRVVVTDHHEPPEELPACPILHPEVSGYPFRGLCAAGVAHKLATALRLSGEQHRDTPPAVLEAVDVDLVALATVADMVPLIGENRRLVRAGLAQLRAAPRSGLRALMAVARVDRETVNAGDLGFRLAPRINAAGRLYRADGGVELMLTDDADRAAAIAAELDRANSERRATEQEVAAGAEKAVRARSPEEAAAPALVLAGEGWHPGVVGIAASRLADKHWCPTVLLSLSGDRARGSARSIPGFDLIAALDACSEHLERYGGHRAAAGLELRADRLDAFRTAFLEYAAGVLDSEELVRSERVDALVGVGRGGIGLELAEQLERLGPFGVGNPGPRLLVPAGRMSSISPLGEEGKHSRFNLESGSGRAMGVAFGMNGEVTKREGETLDLAIELEVDRWNGGVQPRVVLRELYPLAETTPPGPTVGCGDGCPAPAGEWWDRMEASRAAGPPPAHYPHEPRRGPSREVVDRRRGAAVAALAELISTGEPVLAVCADASRRRALAEAAADPRRFGARAPRFACCRCGDEALGLVLPDAGPDDDESGLVLTDWWALARRREAVGAFSHVVVIDPAPYEGLEEIVRGARPDEAHARGFLHLAWGSPEVGFAELCHSRDWELRGAIAEIWRALSEAGGAAGDELRGILSGPGRHARTPEVAGRCLAVLCELGLCEWNGAVAGPELSVVSSSRTELERSQVYRACAERHQEAIRYLRGRAQESGATAQTAC